MSTARVPTSARRAARARARRSARVVLMLLVAALALTAIAFGVLSAIYSPTYIARWAVWQEADVGDQARFPSRIVRPAAEPFIFRSALDPAGSAARVRQALEGSPSVGSDAEAFLEATGTQAFIVIQDDTILYERYVGAFWRDSVATSFSVAKSYLSALVGIAFEDGAIRSVDDPITRYLPELVERDARFGSITIRHLLDMTSGIHYEETGLPNGDDALTYYFDDLRALALERTTIDEPPGQRWHYTNYNPLLLGLILERTTGVRVADYLADRLWTRIGSEFEASWSLDHENGLEKLESGLNARPIDFAKFGRLYLNGGVWAGEQVVPSAWVEASIQTVGDDPTGYYPPVMVQPFGSISHRMYWWRIDRSDGADAFSTLGNHGQFVFVVPDERLIVVRFGERYGIPAFDWFEVLSTLGDSLRPAS